MQGRVTLPRPQTALPGEAEAREERGADGELLGVRAPCCLSTGARAGLVQGGVAGEAGEAAGGPDQQRHDEHQDVEYLRAWSAWPGLPHPGDSPANIIQVQHSASI